MTSETPQGQDEARFWPLLKENVKVVGGVMIFALLVFGLWLGLARLFPEIEWLQPPAQEEPVTSNE